MRTLRECPHCGESVRLAVVVVDQHLFAVECGECCARGPVHPTRTTASEGWNARHDEATEPVA